MGKRGDERIMKIYFENEKKFFDEIKSIFLNFLMAIIC